MRTKYGHSCALWCECFPRKTYYSRLKRSSCALCFGTISEVDVKRSKDIFSTYSQETPKQGYFEVDYELLFNPGEQKVPNQPEAPVLPSGIKGREMRAQQTNPIDQDKGSTCDGKDCYTNFGKKEKKRIPGYLPLDCYIRSRQLYMCIGGGCVCLPLHLHWVFVVLATNPVLKKSIMKDLIMRVAVCLFE